MKVLMWKLHETFVQVLSVFIIKLLVIIYIYLSDGRISNSTSHAVGGYKDYFATGYQINCYLQWR